MHIQYHIYNGTGSAFFIGQPLKLDGTANGGIPSVIPWDGTGDLLGLCWDITPPVAHGFVLSAGRLSGYNTNGAGWTVGDTIWVDIISSTLVNADPGSGAGYSTKVGSVAVDGSINVSIPLEKIRIWHVRSSSYTAVAGDKIQASMDSAWTLTLPASPSIGTRIEIDEATLLGGVNNLTIARNGSNINSAASNYAANVNGFRVSCTYINSTIGWSIK